MKSFVDNVGVLVVELCLVSKLPTLFAPDMIFSIPDNDIAHLACEQEHAAAERHRLMEKKACLEKCEMELRRLDKHRAPIFEHGVPNVAKAAKVEFEEGDKTDEDHEMDME